MTPPKPNITKEWIAEQRERAAGSDMVGTEFFLAALDEIEALKMCNKSIMVSVNHYIRDLDEAREEIKRLGLVLWKNGLDEDGEVI